MPREPRFNLPGVTNGVLADVLRLEIETDPAGLVNLIVNPDGSLGGYGWEATSGGTLVRSATTNGPALEFVASTGAPFFLTEYMAVTAGHYLAARWLEAGYTGPGTGGWYRARFDYYNAAGTYVSSSVYTSWYQLTTNVRAYGPVVVPATVTKARLHIDLASNNAGGNLSGGTGYYRYTDVTVATSAVSGDLGIVRTNLLTNPSFTTNSTGWQNEPNEAGSAVRIAAPSTMLSADQTAMGFAFKVSSGGDQSIAYGRESATRAVTPLSRYYIRARFAWRPNLDGYLQSGDSAHASVQWFNDASGSRSGAASLTDYTSSLTAPDANGWVFRDHGGYIDIPASGVTGMRVAMANTMEGGGSFLVDKLLLEKVPAGTTGERPYFDGGTTDAAGWVYDWTGTANASTSTAASPELDYIPPVPTIDILDSAYSLSVGVTRNALDVGTITAEVADAALDPADSDLIRPGRACRLTARDAAGEWQPIYTGKLNAATVTYPLLAKVPDAKKARIVLSGTDNISTLAATKRLSSVATIAELPFVLEGAGVPWNVNGSGAQVGAAIVRTYDENATALDQVAMTRDTVSGYAWVNKRNTLEAWDAATIDDTPVLTLDEDVYTGNGVAISFDTDACINEVTVVRRSVDALGGAVEETSTYTDTASIKQWGRHSATFTVLAPVAPAMFAAAVLAANATPVRRITSVTVNIKDETYLPVAHLDMYDVVTLVNTEKSISQDAFITGIQHAIVAGKWLVTFTFSSLTAVAAPQLIPPLKAGAVGHPAISVYKTSAQSLTANTTTTILMNVIRFGPSGGLVLDSGTVTISASGWYQVNGCVTFAASTASARRIVWIGIGSSPGALSTFLHTNTVASAQDTSNFTTLSVSAVVYLTTGQVVGVGANAATGWGIEVSQTYMNNLSVARIGG